MINIRTYKHPKKQDQAPKHSLQVLNNTFTMLKVKNIEKSTIRYYLKHDSGRFIRCSQGIFEYYESIANRIDCIYNTHKNGVVRFYKTVYCK